MQGTRYGGLGIGISNAVLRRALRRLSNVQTQVVGASSADLTELRDFVVALDSNNEAAIDSIRNFADGGSELELNVEQLLDGATAFDSALTVVNASISDINADVAAVNLLVDAIRSYSDPTSALEILLTDMGTSFSDLSSSVCTLSSTIAGLADLIDAIRNYTDSSSTLAITIADLESQLSALPAGTFTTEEVEYLEGLASFEPISYTDIYHTTTVKAGSDIVLLQHDPFTDVEIPMLNLNAGAFRVTVSGNNSIPTVTRDFTNTEPPSSMNDGELVTWSFMRQFIDSIFPIGVLMISTNGSPPSTFGGHIVWAVYSAANGKYLKMTTSGVNVGSAQLSEVMQHRHQPGTLALSSDGLHTHTNTFGIVAAGGHSHTVTAEATTSDGAHIHGLSTVITNTTTQHSHTGTTTVGDGGHRHYPSTGTYNGSAINGSDAAGSINGSVAADVGFFTVAVGETGDGRHTHTFTTDPVVGHSHTLIGNSDSSGAHTHTVTGTTDAIAAHTHTLGGSIDNSSTHTHLVTGLTDYYGVASNEVDAIYVLIYIRTA